MPEARITDVAVLADFRAALAEFALAARQGLIAIELEVRRALDWISNDRAVYWQSEVRRSTDILARAKDELAHSRTFKRIGDYTPSCVEEKKAVDIARRRLEHAEQKVAAVRRWALTAQRAVDEFQGPVQQLLGMLDGDVPRALATLERMSIALEKYAAIGAPGAIPWEELIGGNVDRSMAQADDESSALAADVGEVPATEAADRNSTEYTTP